MNILFNIFFLILEIGCFAVGCCLFYIVYRYLKLEFKCFILFEEWINEKFKRRK